MKEGKKEINIRVKRNEKKKASMRKGGKQGWKKVNRKKN